jgi:hypothetical protein
VNENQAIRSCQSWSFTDCQLPIFYKARFASSIQIRPNAIEEINYQIGRHFAAPVGRIAFPADREVMLLHYKQLGLEYLLWRSQALKDRTTALDRERGWGAHYYRPADQIGLEFEMMFRSAEYVIV